MTEIYSYRKLMDGQYMQHDSVFMDKLLKEACTDMLWSGYQDTGMRLPTYTEMRILRDGEFIAGHTEIASVADKCYGHEDDSGWWKHQAYLIRKTKSD